MFSCRSGWSEHTPATPHNAPCFWSTWIHPCSANSSRVSQDRYLPGLQSCPTCPPPQPEAQPLLLSWTFAGSASKELLQSLLDPACLTALSTCLSASQCSPGHHSPAVTRWAHLLGEGPVMPGRCHLPSVRVKPFRSQILISHKIIMATWLESNA